MLQQIRESMLVKQNMCTLPAIHKKFSLLISPNDIERYLLPFVAPKRHFRLSDKWVVDMSIEPRTSSLWSKCSTTTPQLKLYNIPNKKIQYIISLEEKWQRYRGKTTPAEENNKIPLKTFNNITRKNLTKHLNKQNFIWLTIRTILKNGICNVYWNCLNKGHVK